MVGPLVFAGLPPRPSASVTSRALKQLDEKKRKNAARREASRRQQTTSHPGLDQISPPPNAVLLLGDVNSLPLLIPVHVGTAPLSTTIIACPPVHHVLSVPPAVKSPNLSEIIGERALEEFHDSDHPIRTCLEDGIPTSTHKRARLSEDMAKGGAIDNEMLDNTSSSTDPGKHQNCTGIQVAALASEQPQSASRRRRRRAWKDLTPEQQLKRVIASRIRRARKLASSALTEERTTPTMGTSTIPEERDDSRHGRGAEEVLCGNCSSRI